MKTSALISLFLSLPSAAFAALSSVPFGGVNLQLQSSISDKDPETLLVEVLTQTVQYLDRSFGFILEGSESDFSHIGLSVDSFDFDPSDEKNSNSVSFSFSGTAFFNTSPPPSQDDVLKILAQSFLGRNSQVFTSTLMQSTTPFLQRLSYAIVQVNGLIIPGSVVPEAPADTQEAGQSSSIGIEQIALIAGSTTAAVLLLLLCYCFLCVRGESDDQLEIKPTLSASETNETEDDVEAAVSQAPSSPQSIASQDSSVFTYNPTGTSRMSFDASTLSTNTLETNVDLASWQQKNTINSSRFAPFGHDISAIEMLNENKKDLSLIEEGEEEATPVKREYLSRDFLSMRERRERAGDVSFQSEDSDVIADLRNLSQQINRHRRR